MSYVRTPLSCSHTQWNQWMHCNSQKNALVCFIEYCRSHCTETLQWVAKPLCHKRQWTFLLQWSKTLQWNLWSFLIANSLKLDYRYLISIICMLLFTCRIFSAKNLCFSKSASLQQFFSHDERQCSDGILVSFCVIAALFLKLLFFAVN